MEQKATRGQKVGAFFIGWLGAGILWGVGTTLGASAGISTDSTIGTIGEIVGIVLVIFVWAKLYQHYVYKWAKNNKSKTV